MELPPITPDIKTGRESFTFNQQPLPANMLSFWQWSASDLVGNAMRGILAEYIVALAVGQHHGVRTEWDPYDLTTDNGIKVEVKSAAYIQSWYQKDYSKISFSIRPTQAWDARTCIYETRKCRQADIYVFCLLDHHDSETIDPLNLNQWTFYVVATPVLDQHIPEAKQLSLKKLQSLNPVQCDFQNLAQCIDEVHAASRSSADS